MSDEHLFELETPDIASAHWAYSNVQNALEFSQKDVTLGFIATDVTVCIVRLASQKNVSAVSPTSFFINSPEALELRFAFCISLHFFVFISIIFIISPVICNNSIFVYLYPICSTIQFRILIFLLVQIQLLCIHHYFPNLANKSDYDMCLKKKRSCCITTVLWLFFKYNSMGKFVGSWIQPHGAVSRAIMALFWILAHVAVPENSLIATGCNKRGFT